MSSPLVDPEGFPRADIDVYTVRHARAALVRLRNDHRAVVEEMGRVLQVVYAAPEGQEVAAVVRTEGGAVERRSVNGTGRVQVALAKVNAVAPGSPAAQAVRFFLFSAFSRILILLLQGMERNDLILEFGHLDGDSSLADVGALVASSEGVRLASHSSRSAGY
jgi:26S proteasome non-ATPase regulatory subunit 9